MPGTTPSVVGLVPARAGSKRIKDKNIRSLRGHPLLAYTICAARASGVFDAVVLCTDSEEYAEIGRHYGAEVPFLRPTEISSSTSPDIEWVRMALDRLEEQGRTFDAFSILRPTSPFRQPETIRRCWDQFKDAEGVDSIRAVSKVSEHPGKMWVLRGGRMTPLMPLTPENQPWHSSQYAALPPVYVQNASLEMAWTRVAREGGTIAGTVLMPLVSEGHEGADINQPEDWFYVEYLLDNGEAVLPEIDRPPYPGAGA